jgi:serine phosphatase RsbU (regulator of sigma subunit)
MKAMNHSWPFLVDDRSELSSIYDMIIINRQRTSLRTLHNHQRHEETVILENITTALKSNDECTLSSTHTLIEVSLSENKIQTLSN